MFYRVTQFYVKTDIENSYPQYYSRAVVSFFQFFNLAAILYLLFSFQFVPVGAGIIGLGIYILNGIFFFNKKNLKKDKERWYGEEKRIRKRKGVLIIVYMITSLILFVWTLSKM